MSMFIWIIIGIVLLVCFSIAVAMAQATRIRRHATQSVRKCGHRRLTRNTGQCLDCGYIFH